jgi:hypothetical protein
MARQWAEPSWSSRTWPKWPAHVWLGQPLPDHQPLSHTLISRMHTCFSPPPSLARCAAALLWLFADHLRRGHPPEEMCLLMLYSILQLNLVLAVSRVRPQPWNPSGHEWFWPQPATPNRPPQTPASFGRPGCRRCPRGMAPLWSTQPHRPIRQAPPLVAAPNPPCRQGFDPMSPPAPTPPQSCFGWLPAVVQAADVVIRIVCPIFHDAPTDLIDLPITWAEHATWRLGNANPASNSTMNDEPHAESTRQ